METKVCGATSSWMSRRAVTVGARRPRGGGKLVANSVDADGHGPGAVWRRLFCGGANLGNHRASQQPRPTGHRHRAPAGVRPS